jgi:hypothetical protein
MNNNIQNVCLANDNGQKYKGQKVTVAGWGTLSEGGPQPAKLMKVDVKVWSNAKCKQSYGNSAPGGITNHMLCASSFQKDSCSVSICWIVEKREHHTNRINEQRHIRYNLYWFDGCCRHGRILQFGS